MRNSQKKIRKKLFEIFSKNLGFIKEHPSIKFEPDFSDGYICPLCFEVFFEKDLDNTLTNYLTLEDVPPASLGGRPITLTCKKCNSRSGHDLDSHLLNTLLEDDFHSFLPSSKSKSSFRLNEHTVNGIVEFDESGVMKIDIQPKRSNPVHLKEFNRDFLPRRTIYNPIFNPDKISDSEFHLPTIKMIPIKAAKERRAEIALLRIGYLLAYATLGNGFLLNSGLFKVREQILFPDKDILPKVFWLKYEFPKECEGISIILHPKELQSFLVIFNLKTKSVSRQYAIVLPGPSMPGLEVYTFIEEKLCVGDGTSFVNVTCEHLPTINYFKNMDTAFGPVWFWQEFTKDDYKPTSPHINNS